MLFYNLALIPFVGEILQLRNIQPHFCDSITTRTKTTTSELRILRYPPWISSFDHHHLHLHHHQSSSFSLLVRHRMYSHNGNEDEHNVQSGENSEDDVAAFAAANSNANINATSNATSNNNDSITVYRNFKKKSAMKELDHRDALPFQIQLHAPPDYHTTTTSTTTTTNSISTTTPRSTTKSKSSMSSQQDQKKKSSDSKPTTRTTMVSSLYRSNEDSEDDTDTDKDNNNNNNDKNNNLKKSYKKQKNNAGNNFPHSQKDGDGTNTLLLQKLGDYVLDAATTTGDTIVLSDNTVYRVIRHRCLYQYKQKQFVMCRKILEVKELNRYLSEQYIMKQFNL